MTQFQNSGTFTEGAKFTLNGRLGVFSRVDKNGGQVQLQFDKELPRTYTYSAIISLYFEGKLILGEVADNDRKERIAISDEDRITIKQRTPFVMPLFEEKAPTSRAAQKRVLQKAKEEHPSYPVLTLNKIAKLYKQVKKLGSKVGLLDPKIVRRKRFEIDPRLFNIIEFLYENRYLKTLKENYSQGDFITSIKEQVDHDNRHLDDEAKIPYPSQSTISRYTQAKFKLDPLEVTRKREGEQTYRILMRGMKGGQQTSRILEVLEIDGTLLDIIIGDVENGIILGRPYLVITRCRYSKSICGYALGFQGESTDLISKALRNSIVPKVELLSHYKNVRNEWPCSGIPFEIVVDLGSGFISESFEDMCAILGAHITNTPAASPWFKGAIESLFSGLGQGLLEHFPAHTKKDKDLMAMIQQGKVPVVSLTEFYELLLEWIVDIYQKTPHGVTAVVPDQAWRAQEDIVKPRHPNSIAMLDVAMGHTKTVTLQEYGIQFEHIRYKCKEMAQVYKACGKGQKLKIKYQADDLGIIHFENPLDQTWYPAQSQMRNYAKGLSMREHKMHRRRILDAKMKAVTSESLLQSKLNHRKRCEQLAKKFETNRAKTSRKERSEFKLHLVHSSDIPTRSLQTAELLGAIVEMNGLASLKDLPNISKGTPAGSAMFDFTMFNSLNNDTLPSAGDDQ